MIHDYCQGCGACVAACRAGGRCRWWTARGGGRQQVHPLRLLLGALPAVRIKVV